MKQSRRSFLFGLGVATAASGIHNRLALGSSAVPPTRIITHADGFFWFGYYDKFQFSPDNRFVLSNRVRFEHRSPTAADEIEIGMIDLEDGDRWIPLG
jgi:hypothetical protein